MGKETEIVQLLKTSPALRESLMEFLGSQIKYLLDHLETEMDMDLSYMRYVQGRIKATRDILNLVRGTAK